VPARGPTGDTPITILAHEAGHLFLAYASIRDPGDPAARPMLGSQEAHWGFNFNSDASLLEGNRIQDGSPASVPEFTTVGTVEGYSRLDQYLMGFLPPDQVEPGYPFGVYLVTGVPASLHTRLPQVGVSFNGTRRDVHMDELIQAEGRRTPDSTVAQRRFRFAIILLVAANTPPPAAELAQLETYRTAFEAFYQQASGNHAFADTALRHSLHISAFPAAGTMTGATTPVTLSVDTPPAAPLTVALAAPNGAASVPTSVTIAAGARSASFNVTGIRAGVEELSATPDDSRYDAAYARIQVSPAAALQLNAIPGAGPMPHPVTAQVTDINRLPYPGVSLRATASAGGSVTPAVAVTDAAGSASFRWNPGAGSNQQLRIAVANAPDVAAVLGPVQAAAVLNAASLAEAAAPGMLAAIYGFNLGAAGTELMLDGRALQVIDVDDSRIRFYIPPDTPLGTSTLTISNALGRAPPVAVPVSAVAPGIFYDYGTGFALGVTQPVAAGSVIQIFCTGLGTQPDQVQAAIGGVPGAVQYSGAAPGLVGVNQVNAQVPAVAAGTQPLSLTIGGVTSNEVRIGVQ
jgi:uncharacterized protein (TIGR03437 family)